MGTTLLQSWCSNVMRYITAEDWLNGAIDEQVPAHLVSILKILTDKQMVLPDEVYIHSFSRLCVLSSGTQRCALSRYQEKYWKYLISLSRNRIHNLSFLLARLCPCTMTGLLNLIICFIY